MVIRTGPTNTELQMLIVELKKQAIKSIAPIWKRVATDLEKPTRIRRIVNLTRIDRMCKDGDVIIVPGKILGGGELNKKITVAAFNISMSAATKLNQKNCSILTISDLMKKNPKGTNIRLIG